MLLCCCYCCKVNQIFNFISSTQQRHIIQITKTKKLIVVFQYLIFFGLFGMTVCVRRTCSLLLHGMILLMIHVHHTALIITSSSSTIRCNVNQYQQHDMICHPLLIIIIIILKISKKDGLALLQQLVGNRHKNKRQVQNIYVRKHTICNSHTQ